MDQLQHMILDKAKERFDRFGFKKTTMDELSRDCKISKRTLYEMFGDKENLFHRLFIREGQAAQEMIFASAEGIDDPVEHVKQLIRTAVRYFSEDNFLTRMLKDEKDLFWSFTNKTCSDVVEVSTISRLAKIIETGKERGAFREVDPQVVSYAAFRLFEAFSYLKTVEFDKDKEEQGYYTETLIDFIMNGLAC